MLASLLVGCTAYNLPLRQPVSSIRAATYAESVARLTCGQQVVELERLCSSVSREHRLAMPEELQLLQQELARMKYAIRLSDGEEYNFPMADLAALEVAETVAGKVAEAVVASSEAAEFAAIVAARAVKTEPTLSYSMQAIAEGAAAEAEQAGTMQVEREFGRDPRLAPQWVRENPKMLKELALLSRTQPNPAYSSTSSAVSSMLTLADFEEALESAGQSDKLVVIKFYQVRCRACLNARAPYEKAAKGPLAESADFYEVDASVARALCTLAKIEQLPVAHVYSRGQLVDTRPLHTPPAVRDFIKGLELHADGFSS